MIDVDERSQEIFRLVVEEYLKHGMAIGSKTIQSAGIGLSSATIRNVMARLEEEELLFSPHVSSGRKPTEKGLRFFVDRLMKIDELPFDKQKKIEDHLFHTIQNSATLYDGTSTLLSGLSSCVGLVITPKSTKPVKQIQFMILEPKRILTILVLHDGQVENRVIQLDAPVTQDDLNRLSNYLNDHITGKTLSEFKDQIKTESIEQELQLKGLTQTLIDKGIIHPLSSLEEGHIFIQGQSKLIEDPAIQENLEELRALLNILDEKKNLLQIMSAVESGSGVQVFIGSENPILQQPSWSTIIKAYRDQNGKVIGATGIIGPTRLNYGKIVPIVDYTTLLMERILGIHT